MRRFNLWILYGLNMGLWIEPKAVQCLGCIPQLCDGNPNNTIANADCTVHKDHCGSYGGKRLDNSQLKGIDIECAADKFVFAPFDGVISFHRPRGGQRDSRCIDQGLKIQGSGKWAGYMARISFIKPVKYNGPVKQASIIGTALDLSCASGMIASSAHVVFELLFQGRPVDPTHRVSECMCTGQICTSNSINEFVGLPFKHKVNFGKGYEIRCANTREDEQSSEVIPTVNSPIDAMALGRFRPRNPFSNGTFACDNDGVYLSGTGNWKNFEVHIYNVKFTLEPGLQSISQGDTVAQRLTCPGADIQSIFLEFRYQGKLVNVTNLIIASDCKLPQLPA